MYIFFDTETTGLPKINYKDFRNTKNTDSCRLVQLAYMIVDPQKQILKKVDHIIKPKGFKIENSHLHGITQEKAIEEGKEITRVLLEFIEDLKSRIAIAHNVAFDEFILNAELHRANAHNTLEEYAQDFYCTMQESTNTVKIGWNDYHQSYKWPKLYELADFLIEKGYEIEYEIGELHNAMVDVELLRKCYFALNDYKQNKQLRNEDSKLY